MPPFQYETPGSPLAGSIADIIARGGDIRAQSAVEMARINAAATAQRGAMWGNTISNLSQLPLQLQQQKREDATAQASAMYRNMQMAQIGQQLQEHQRTTADQDTFENALRELYPQFKKTDDETGQTSVDYAGLGDALRAKGVREDLSAGWMQKAIQGETIRAQQTQAQVAARKAVLEEFGRIAHESQTPEAFQERLQMSVKAGVVPPTSAHALNQQLNENYDNYEAFAGKVKSLAPAAEAYYLEQEKKKADIAHTQAQTAAELKKEPPTVPLEQQLLKAKASGDDVTFQRILGVVTEEAKAKRDPDAQAQARALAALSRESAQLRLDKLKEDAKPYDIGPDIKTTSTSKPYVDLSSYTVAERPKVRAAAHAAGAAIVNKEEAGALGEVDNARLNQRKIMDQIGDLLPRDPVGRIIANPLTKLDEIFQTQDQIAAFKSWRTTAIQTLRAVAGSKGLRINEAEILLSAANDIPQITDTYKTAQQRYKNVLAQLQSVEDSILVHDRTDLNPDAETVGPPEPRVLTPGLQRLGGRK